MFSLLKLKLKNQFSFQFKFIKLRVENYNIYNAVDLKIFIFFLNNKKEKKNQK